MCVCVCVALCVRAVVLMWLLRMCCSEDRDMTLLHTTVPGSEDAAILTLAHDQWCVHCMRVTVVAVFGSACVTLVY